MAGVYRPYTLTDVLGTFADQSAQQQDTTVTGLGQFGEADESARITDSVTGTVSTSPAWGAGTWGMGVWG